MADENGVAPDRSTKPPAITVRCETWEQYDWITAAAARKKASRGEFLLLGALQRRTGGPVAKSRAELRASGGTVPIKTSAEAKANVKPRPRKPAPAAKGDK